MPRAGKSVTIPAVSRRSVSPAAVAVYLGLLAFHVAHILEEIGGRFFLLDKLGFPAFAAVNWALFCLSLGIFYFWLTGRRWARPLSLIYAGVMVLNGIGHNIMTLVTGRYRGGYAGGFSGIGLAFSGLWLLALLLRRDTGDGPKLRGSSQRPPIQLIENKQVVVKSRFSVDFSAEML